MKLRFVALPLGGVAAVLAGVLLFGDLNGNLVYYLTPTEAVERQPEFAGDRRFRLAGLVAQGTVSGRPDAVAFEVQDGATTVAVLHTGAPPQLFREGIEVVVEGAWRGDTFASDAMLIKHDETYAPPAKDAGGPA